MSKILKLFVALIVIAGCSPKQKDGNLTIVTENGEVRYNVEEAQKPEQLEKGLMNRDVLAADSGMIFDLSKVDNQVAMWMKDTKISLDMLFVNANGRIFFIKENATPMSEELIIAPEPAMAVVELNAGDVKKHNIKAGDIVRHHFFDEYNKEVYEDEGKLPPREEGIVEQEAAGVTEDVQEEAAAPQADVNEEEAAVKEAASTDATAEKGNLEVMHEEQKTPYVR